MTENNVEEGLGGPLELLKWLSRCLLTIGGRSIGHLYSYLDRHDPIMLGLIQTTGDEVSRTAEYQASKQLVYSPQCHTWLCALLVQDEDGNTAKHTYVHLHVTLEAASHMCPMQWFSIAHVFNAVVQHGMTLTGKQLIDALPDMAKTPVWLFVTCTKTTNPDNNSTKR